MTNSFDIKDAKPGDILTARRLSGVGLITHRWIVLYNGPELARIGTDDVWNVDVPENGDWWVGVYVIYAQSPLEGNFTFYHEAFRRWQKKFKWSLEHAA